MTSHHLQQGDRMFSRRRLEIGVYAVFITACSCLIVASASPEVKDVANVKVVGNSSEDIQAEWLKSIPSNWITCTRSSECAVIAFSCSGRFAINRQYRKPAEQIIYRFESAAWAACNVPVSAGMTSTCQESKCIVNPEK